MFPGSPAEGAGFARGQEIIAVNGETVAVLGAAGLADAFGPSDVGVQRTFVIRRQDASEYEVTVTKAEVTTDPVPQYRIIATPAGNVGYLEFWSFISTAEAELATAFADFAAANITDLVLDLRFNGGGLVSIADLLGDYLGGGSTGLVFSRTLFNANNASSNSEELFQSVANSLILSRLVVIASSGTASASELVINSLEPHAAVTIVGADTFGKPVGQVAVDFCDLRMRPTAFETVNSLNQGQYFDGLPVDCPSADDLDEPVGADTDPALVTALGFLENNACPPAVPVQEKVTDSAPQPPVDRRDGAWLILNAV